MRHRVPLEQFLMQTVVADGWRIVGIRQHHGIDVFLNALHSHSSSGIGEFLDLLPLIDWCSKIGMDIIQLLPLNDSCLDPSPYNTISSCALNPIYLKLSALPYLDQYDDLADAIAPLAHYNQLSRIAYAEVLAAKMQWLRHYYNMMIPHLEKDPQFFHFKSSFPWVETYALFKSLLILADYQDWKHWPAELRNVTPEKHTQLLEQHQDEIAFHTALQYFCFQQLKQVREHAERHKIFIKGDVPILISRNSADVWHAPSFFDLNYTAGAPPDQYSLDGQSWGFPLFDWETMRKENYRFWHQRLQTASYFYHLYRIDHAVGFFRIWAIPLNHPGKDGSFIPEDPEKYLEQGTHILGILGAAAPMLPIAEDLGAVPEEVRTRLTEMGIPGTRVMRWEVDWTKHNPYVPLKDYSPLSMTCVSTHDSETLGEWWKSHPAAAAQLASQKKWHYTPKLSVTHRHELLKDSHHTNSLFHINLLQEYLALFPELVADAPEDERINIPGVILSSNWTYRYRPSVETLISHKGLLSAMQSLVTP